MRRASLLAILAIAVFLRLYNVATPVFWMDEQMAAASQNRSAYEIVVERLDPGRPINIEPPGYALLNKVMTFFVPAGENFMGRISRFFLRLLSVLAGVGSVALIALLAQSLVGKRADRLPALLLAFSFYAVYYSQENRPYSLVILLSLLDTWLFVEAFLHRKRRLAIPYSLGIAGLCYMHYTAVLLPVIHTVAFLIIWIARLNVQADESVVPIRPGKYDALAFILAGLGALILYSPWLPLTLKMAIDPSLFHAPAVPQTDPTIYLPVKYNILKSSLTHWACDGYLSMATYLPLIILGGVSLFRRSAAYLVSVICFYLIPFAYLFASPYGVYLHPRYLIFIYPIHQLLAGIGLYVIYEIVRKPLLNRLGSPVLAKRIAGAVVAIWLLGLFMQNISGLTAYYQQDIKCDSVEHIDFCCRYIDPFNIWDENENAPTPEGESVSSDSPL